MLAVSSALEENTTAVVVILELCLEFECVELTPATLIEYA